MLPKRCKKTRLIEIVQSLWTDSETVAYIGKKGFIKTNKKKSPFIDVKFNNREEIITFHVTEVKLI